MKKQILLPMTAGWFWAWMTMTAFAATISAAAQIVRWVAPEPEATHQCREVEKGTIAWELPEGVLCVRPVHFIERQ